jgi:hypothetical protein
MPKEYEYHEGKQAQKDFEEGMKALFQVPKDAAKARKKPARSGLKTLKVRPANRCFPPFWRGLKQRGRFPSGLLRASADRLIIGKTFIGNLRKSHFKTGVCAAF